jgi:hypothetical protein
MAFPDDDPTVQHGDRTIQLIDWLVGRLEECLGEVLPLQTDDLLKDYAKDARNSVASAIERLSLARAKKEQQLGGQQTWASHNRCTRVRCSSALESVSFVGLQSGNGEVTGKSRSTL